MTNRTELVDSKVRGTCQICERDVAVSYEADDQAPTSHHGYTRPGWGWLVGGCPGSKRLPYELSADALASYLDTVREYRANRVARMEGLKDGTITKVYTEIFDGYNGRRKKYKRVEITPETVFKGHPDLGKYCSSSHSFEYHRDAEIRRIEKDIAHADREISRIEERVEGWTFNPDALRVVED